MTRRGAATAWGVLGVLAVLVAWELYKFLGPAEGFVLGAVDGQTGSGVMLLPRTGDRAMPHIWEMVARLFQSTSGGDTPPLIVPVVTAALTTLGIAAAGWLIGVIVGALLGLVMQRWRLAEWGLLPWIVVSQTVPLIAFAPLVASIGTQIDRGGTPFPQWLSVAVIASYLSFFPVALGVLRGLEAPDRIHLELMRTYAAGYWQTLWKLRLPAAAPFIFNALKINSTLALIGAIVAEFFGTPIVGMGFRISTEVGKLNIDLVWAEIAVAAVVGSAFYGVIALIERAVTFWHPSVRGGRD